VNEVDGRAMEEEEPTMAIKKQSNESEQREQQIIGVVPLFPPRKRLV
jgi:hypothetical protein